MLECFRGYTCVEYFVTDSQQKAESKCAEWRETGHELMYISHKIGDSKWIAKKLVRNTQTEE